MSATQINDENIEKSLKDSLTQLGIFFDDIVNWFEKQDKNNNKNSSDQSVFDYLPPEMYLELKDDKSIKVEKMFSNLDFGKLYLECGREEQDIVAPYILIATILKIYPKVKYNNYLSFIFTITEDLLRGSGFKLGEDFIQLICGGRKYGHIYDFEEDLDSNVSMMFCDLKRNNPSKKKHEHFENKIILCVIIKDEPAPIDSKYAFDKEKIQENCLQMEVYYLLELESFLKFLNKLWTKERKFSIEYEINNVDFRDEFEKLKNKNEKETNISCNKFEEKEKETKKQKKN